jgi:hypothetical protein
MVIIMNIKRELLKRIANYGDDLPPEFIYEICELLAKHEQNKAAAIMPNGVCVSNVYDAYEEGRKSLMSEQEPVAWITEWVQRYRHNDTPIIDRAVSFTKGDAPAAPNPNYIPLYTAPSKRDPLTDENVCEILLKKEWKGFVDLVRIIEKAHGIGGGNE